MRSMSYPTPNFLLFSRFAYGKKVTVIGTQDDNESEFDPGEEEEDPMKGVHTIGTCEYIFFTELEYSKCVIVDDEAQVL